MALTKAQKLLVAAGKLVASGKLEFSAEDLVVQAHKEFGDDFALKGHSEFPDSNAVFIQLMGKSARMIVNGWLEKTGTKTYRLTPKGHDDLQSIDGVDAGVENKQLARMREEDLGSMLTAPAFEIGRQEDTEAVTFHQFCRFLGLTAGDTWQNVQGKINH